MFVYLIRIPSGSNPLAQLKAHYGERKAIVEAEDWDGPAYQTCREAAVVSAAFPEMFRRRNNLTFSHHKKVAALPPAEADALLDWCEETIKAPGDKPRPTGCESRGRIICLPSRAQPGRAVSSRKALRVSPTREKRLGKNGGGPPRSKSAAVAPPHARSDPLPGICGHHPDRFGGAGLALWILLWSGHGYR